MPFMPEDEKELNYVGDLATPWGIHWQELESVALVAGLRNTGSDPAPSAQKQRLIAEMRAKDIGDTNDILASSSTSLVLVVAHVPPGAEEGDLIDVEVLTRGRSETTSLEGGKLFKTRLRQLEVLNNSFHTGHEAATAEGPVLVDAIFEGEDDKENLRRGMVLGGGRVLQSRPIGLAIRDGKQSIRTATTISGAINLRFYSTTRQGKVGAANPKNNKMVQLAIPSQYKHNIARFLRVSASIALRESPRERVERIELLRRQLLEPTTAAAAALRLEAIGSEAESALIEGLESPHFECRLYAAEALAYQGRSEATPVLLDAAKNKPGFRWHALGALTVVPDINAVEALGELMNVSSAETRYGAFRALATRSPNDSLVQGVGVEGKFRLHVVPLLGEPMVHFARSKQTEIVVFGHDAHLNLTQTLRAGPEILISPVEDGLVRVSRFSPDDNDIRIECSSRVQDVIEAIAKAGGGYGEVYDAMKAAEKSGALPGRLAVDATPKPGEDYYAASQKEDEPGSALPLPQLFQSRWTRNEEEEREDDQDWRLERPPEPTFYETMTDWMIPAR